MSLIFYCNSVIMNSVPIGRVATLRHENDRIGRPHPEIHSPLQSLSILRVTHFPIAQDVVANLELCRHGFIYALLFPCKTAPGTQRARNMVAPKGLFRSPE